LGISTRGKLQRVPTNNKKFRKFNLRRYTGGLVWTAPDKQRLINRLFMKGFCTRTEFPREMPGLSCIEPQVIIQRYNAVLLGMANFYIGHLRNRASVHRWIYIVRYSCLKTFAQKYKFLEEFFQLEFEKYLLFL
jgi:molybdopterin/thiamine biosynthesis adenylyltransferase